MSRNSDAAVDEAGKNGSVGETLARRTGKWLERRKYQVQGGKKEGSPDLESN